MNSQKNSLTNIYQYKYLYQQNEPSTLTITRLPKFIQSFLFIEVKYVWVISSTDKLITSPKQIQELAGLPIEFVSTAQLAKKQIQKQKDAFVVLIYHKTLFEQILDTFKLMIKSFKSIMYGKFKIPSLNINFQVKSVEVDSQLQVIKQMNKYKRFYRKKDYYNFTSLEKQEIKSNILVKTMEAMINQNTSIKQLIQQFKQLAAMCYPKDINRIQQFVSQYNQTNSLNYQLAVQWYTKEGFLFHFINHILRICKDPTCIYIIQPYFSDLVKGVKILYQQQQTQSQRQSSGKFISYRKFRCYRGVQILEKQIKFYEQHKGLVVLNLGFMSTSRNYSTAVAYMKNGLFEIEVDDTPKNPHIDFGFADLSRYSHGEGEQQILFNPLNSFHIVDFRFIEEQKIYKIKLRYGQIARVMAIQDQNLTEQEAKYKELGIVQLKQGKKCKNMGNILIQDDINLQGCQQYCQKFFEIALKSGDTTKIDEAHKIRAKMEENKEKQSKYN